jgi:putative ABC transport system permease protein
MAIYVALGLLAGVAGAWLPAREAATVSPAQALKAGDEAALLGGHGHPWLGLLPAAGQPGRLRHSAPRMGCRWAAIWR